MKVAKKCIQSLRRIFKKIKMLKTKAYLVYNKNHIDGWGVYIYTYSKNKAIQIMKHAEDYVCVRCSHPKDDCDKCPMKKGELFNKEDLMVERHTDADYQYRGIACEFVYYHDS